MRDRHRSCCCPIHHGKIFRVNFFLNGKQIDQRSVNPRVRVMSFRIEQSAQHILHCAGSCGINMAFHCRKMNNILSDKIFRYRDSFWINFIENMHPRFR